MTKRSSSRSQRADRHPSAWWSVPLALLVILAAVVAARATSSGTAGPPALVLLPFEPTADPEPTPLGDLLVRELTVALSADRRTDLRLIGPASIAPYADSAIADVDLARRLGGDLLVSGTVERNGDRTTVFAQTVRVSDGAHLWANRFASDGDPERVAREIADSVHHSVRRALAALAAQPANR